MTVEFGRFFGESALNFAARSKLFGKNFDQIREFSSRLELFDYKGMPGQKERFSGAVRLKI
jgi:hypothetical protein